MIHNCNICPLLDKLHIQIFKIEEALVGDVRETDTAETDFKGQSDLLLTVSRVIVSS